LWLLWLIAGGLLVVGAILWAAVVEPSWLFNSGGLQGADLAKARNDFRNTAVTLLGGFAVLVGGAVAAANLVLTQQAQWRAQVTERFGKAIDQLGQQGPDKLEVRIGAVYALEQIARDSADLHWPIMEMLTAYLRQHSPIKAAQPEQTQPRTMASSVTALDSASGGVTSPVAAATERDTTRKSIPADYQAIATVIGRRRRKQDPDGQRLDLSQTDLSGMRWYKAHLEGADLRGAYLEGADLRGARLEEAYLVGAKLERASLVGAHLDGANLREVHLEGADLRGAYLTPPVAYPTVTVDLRGAHLEGADLRGAHLAVARLQGADLRRTNLTMWQLLSVPNWDDARLPAQLAARLEKAGSYHHAAEPSEAPGEPDSVAD
jgi:hypothetical protein